MAVYLMISYDIIDPQTFSQYPPSVLPILKKHGARVLSSDTSATVVEGEAKMMNALVEFPSEEAVWNCYNDPEYADIKKIQLSSTINGTMVIAKQFQ
ncbi:MAG TPA: DUF1330 domain-containing protein [Chitinophagaceae bacterium]|nr:DUF1330 domain-containing protein [Chitinophagaceae bacterium]